MDRPATASRTRIGYSRLSTQAGPAVPQPSSSPGPAEPQTAIDSEHLGREFVLQRVEGLKRYAAQAGVMLVMRYNETNQFQVARETIGGLPGPDGQLDTTFPVPKHRLCNGQTVTVEFKSNPSCAWPALATATRLINSFTVLTLGCTGALLQLPRWFNSKNPGYCVLQEIFTPGFGFKRDLFDFCRPIGVARIDVADALDHEPGTLLSAPILSVNGSLHGTLHFCVTAEKPISFLEYTQRELQLIEKYR